MKYKIGDYVIYIDKQDSDQWEREKGVTLYNSIAKIIKITDNPSCYPYVLEFQKNINSYSFEYGIGKKEHCLDCQAHQIKSLNTLKLKKLVEQGV